MRLGLSSAAAPVAPLGELLDACVRRGLTALELERGHGHGVGPELSTDATADVARTVRGAGVRLAGYRLTPAEETRAEPDPRPASATAAADGASRARAWAGFAAVLEVPLLVSLDPRGAGMLERLTALGTDVLAVLPADPFAVDPAVLDAARGLPLAWDADPAAGLAAVAPRVLDRWGHRLRHIRLHGGGPEATEQEGRGVGALMARLALSGYAGTVALAPSSPRYRVIWDAWLGRRGGWGCGSRSEDRSLVSLASDR